MLSSTFLLRQLGATAKRLGWIIGDIYPSVLVTDTIRSVLVLLLPSANQNDMGFDFVVAGNGGTAVSPCPPDLDVLV